MAYLDLVCTRQCLAETDPDDNLLQEILANGKQWVNKSHHAWHWSVKCWTIADQLSIEQIANSLQSEAMDDDCHRDLLSNFHDPESLSSPWVNSPSACYWFCCTHFTIAHQRKELKGSKPALGKQTYSRSLQTSWYVKYPWICVCTSSYNRSQGFSNWTKAQQRFTEHEKSEMHQEVTVKIAKASMVDAEAQLIKQWDADQGTTVPCCWKILECVHLFGQGCYTWTPLLWIEGVVNYKIAKNITLRVWNYAWIKGENGVFHYIHCSNYRRLCSFNFAACSTVPLYLWAPQTSLRCDEFVLKVSGYTVYSIALKFIQTTQAVCRTFLRV